MTNRPKEAGTRFETAVRNYIARQLDDERIERRALHGSRDMGDLYGLVAHGFSGIVECKWRGERGHTAAELAKYKDQTLAERENADAGFALLVCNRYNHGVGEALCYCTIRDLTRICLGVEGREGHVELYDDAWVCMTLAEACALMRGV